MDKKGQNGDGGPIIDIDALVSSMEKMMPPPPPGNVTSKACIFKTPAILFRHNEKAYLPNAFSIGPFHHGQPHLQDGEKIKLYYLQSLLRRAPTPQTNLKDLIEAVAKIEGDARACYAAATDTLNKEEFTKMLVLDGCFLLEFFRKKYQVVGLEEDDHVLKVPSMLHCLSHDLILLENQIPWFVLQRLDSMTRGIYSDEALIKMVHSCFPYEFSDRVFAAVKPTPQCEHILSLLRETLILSNTQEDFMTGDKSLYAGAQSSFPSATSLVEAGVKLRKLSPSNSILEIKFDSDSGVLEISPFPIEDTTEATFRNLISFEQSSSGCKLVITSYLILLDYLINSSKDLTILRDKGIVNDCFLNVEDATRVFNGLLDDCFVNQFYYTDLCRRVNAYCTRKLPRWRAMYLRNYFGTPWAIASQVVAALLLIFAFLQTLFTVIR